MKILFDLLILRIPYTRLEL